MSDSAGGSRRSGRLRRSVEAALAVAVWMALGWSVAADANAYLLMGVPITVAFHLVIRRRRLHELWVRDAVRFSLDRWAALLAASFAITPVATLVWYGVRAPRVDWIRVVWLLAAAAGALGAGFTFRHLTRATLRSLLACLGTAGLIAVGLILAARSAGRFAAPLTVTAVLQGVRWVLLYLPVTFVLEEVFFRGALDAHVHQVGEPRGLASAVFVSALWGIWHLPIVEPGPSPALSIGGLVVTHVAIGIPLSIYWRRSGSLAVPGTTHAVINGVRNALLGGPV